MQPSPSIYVGIDPSLTKTGLAILVGADAFATKLIKVPGEGVSRLRGYRDELKTNLEFMIMKYRSGIAHICIEDASYGSTNRADSLGQLRGVLAVCAADFCEKVTLVAPTRLKLFATGSGSSDKAKMIKAAVDKWGVDPGISDDEADALWLAFMAQALAGKVGTLKRSQLETIRGIREPSVKRRVRTRTIKNNI